MASKKKAVRKTRAVKGTPAPVPAVPSVEAVGGTVEAHAPSGRAGQFVLVSDLHAHPWAAFGRGDGAQNSRLVHTLRVLRASLQAAAEAKVPWVFGGDLVHTAGYTLNVVLSAVVDVLLDFPHVPKLMVWGNHDARGIGGKIALSHTVLASLVRTVPGVVVLDPTATPLWEDPDTGLTYSGAGYQPRADLLQLAPPAHVGVYHQTVRGTKTPHGVVLPEGVDPALLQARHRLSVVGHVHHWQWAGGLGAHGGRSVLIPGSPEQHNFGDAGEHGWWLVTVPADGAVDAVMTAGGSPEFRTVASVAEVKDDGHYYRVTAVRDGEAVPDGAVVVAPSPNAVPARDTLRGARGAAAVAAWVVANPPDGEVGAAHYQAVGEELLPAAEVGMVRPVRLTRVELQDFCSYQQQVLDVTPGVRLVLGQGRDFPSNGAGKSTLFEAIFWALFGRTTKGLSGDEVVRWGADGCAVTLRFESADGTELIEVTRRRGKGAGVSVMTQDGPLEAKSATDLTAALAQYLGVTPELYQALGYFSQERLLLFASATDGERKEMLADLIGLDAYQAAAQAAAAQAQQLEDDARQHRVRVETLAQQLEQAEAAHAQAATQATAWAEQHTARVDQVMQALADFDAGAAGMLTAQVAAATEQWTRSHGQQLAQARLAVQDHRTAHAQAQEAAPPYDEAAHVQAEQAVTDAYQEVHRCKGLREAAVREAEAVERRRVQQAQALGAGRCPTCQQDVAEEHRAACLAPVEAEVREAAERVSAAHAAQLAAAEEALRLNKVAEPHRQAQKYHAEVSKWASLLAQAEASVADLERADAAGRAAIAENVAVRLRQEREALARCVVAARQEVNPYANTVLAAEARVRDVTAAQKTAEAAAVAAQKQAAVYAYWKHGFSKQGLQSLLVDEVARLFNDARGLVFPALTQGVYDVQFSTVSQTKSGEWRERTEFQVFERGQPVPYASLSGGQRRRVDVGVMLTLVQAVADWMQAPGMLGVLILDEVFGFLDTSGAEGMVEALREVQQRIPAVFVVSHESHLQALFPDAVVVRQGADGVSVIVEEGE